MTAASDDLKTRLRTTWMTGDYGRFARYMEDDARKFYDRLAVPEGARLLDVGCGAGQVALIAARNGAIVTGCDIAPNWLKQARIRAREEGLSIEFDEADAEALPYADASFDAVVSLVGAMFAPRPERVAIELVRVTKPGGLIAMGNWTPDGFIGGMFKLIAQYIAPSGMPSPVLWGDESVVTQRLGRSVSKLTMTRRMYRFDYPFAPDGVVEFFRENYGPMTRAFASLGLEAQAGLRSKLVAFWTAANQGGETRTVVDAEYLEVVAWR